MNYLFLIKKSLTSRSAITLNPSLLAVNIEKFSNAPKPSFLLSIMRFINNMDDMESLTLGYPLPNGLQTFEQATTFKTNLIWQRLDSITVEEAVSHWLTTLIEATSLNK